MAITKTEDGKEYKASAYLYVPDPEKPSTWKLRIEETPGEVTVAQLGRAAAALGPGFRGRRVQLPADERRTVARKLIGLYRKHDVADEDIPEYLFTIAGMKKADVDGADGVRISKQEYTFHIAVSKAFGDPDDPNTLLVEGYASTGVVDRTGDRILPAAFKEGLAAYMRNPVVLFNHDIDKPVGKVIEAAIDEVGLRVKVAIDKTLDWGRKVADMAAKGILNAFSVRAVNDVAEGWVDANGVRNIANWDLREISVVTVPAHQQALFSVAKSLRDGTDLIETALGMVPEDTEVNVETQEKAPEAQVPEIDMDAVVAKAIAELEARQKAEREAAEQEAAKRAEWEKELRQKWEAEQKSSQPSTQQPPFPVAAITDEDPGAEAMRNLGRIIVSSKYDRLGDLDLVTRYYLLSRAAKAGQAPRPSERFYRATMARAAQFMRAEDEVPVWEPRPGARPKAMRVPAFDPAVAQPYVAGPEDTVDVVVDGKVVARNVRHNDNVTAKGLTQLLEIGAKADEVVYSTQSSYGDEWVPTLMSAMLWRTIRLNAAVLPLFDQFDMPSQPYDWPTESSDPTFYKAAETTDESQLVIGSSQPIPDSKIGTAKVTFSAGKLGAFTSFSEEMIEDAIVNVQAQFRDQFGVSHAHAIDELLISGDETTSNANISDYGNGSISTSWRLLILDGLRHEPLVTTTADARDAGTLTVDDVNAVRALMGTRGKYAADPSQLVIVCDIPTAFKFQLLGEVLTLDKFGPQATVLTGQLGSIMGIPIVMSEDYGLTDTSGYINNTTASNTKGSHLLVNRLGVKVGWRRRPRIFVGQIPYSEAWYIMTTSRLDIGYFGAGMVGLNYNITV